MTSRPLRIASINVNGIRAAARKGMGAWLEEAAPDIVTLQEVRGELEHLEEAMPGWRVIADASLQKGRAGVAIASREECAISRVELGDDGLESSGRWIEADFEVGGETLTVVSAYVFTGEAETPAKQDPKWAFLDAMEHRMTELAADGALALVTGDLNVGHRPLDIRNWKGNVKKAGFLARERAYFDRILTPAGEPVAGQEGIGRGMVGELSDTRSYSAGATGLGWVDVGRAAHGEVDGPYTWWSMRGKAFDTDTGWRIDYHLASPALAPRASNYRVDRAPSYDTRWSDHAPVVAEYAIG
ncbi:exodeoxyribonuclease III [Microbacterium sediminis]|uniref:Exodeoxyribonuclease III n=1 Tax=Microbacterium sediminis TaxID=904291 RepID=A0A1B9NCD6_9MICO|nr:exodeoxyribonuclease III [Microbacterium sediminis]OCG74266.1 exodeoxyribonuclease III [Microbacterium sediminis]QBR73626.1 exodeoxyribonuclease III [Microbacterium sediminis]